jgi:hypothetical protein
MTVIATTIEQAELALAAYATLTPGPTNTPQRREALVGAGLSPAQAEEFARKYPEVVTQYNDTATGFSATVFAAADGQLHLAIRGTEASDMRDVVPTDASIGLYGPLRRGKRRYLLFADQERRSFDDPVTQSWSGSAAAGLARR